MRGKTAGQQTLWGVLAGHKMEGDRTRPTGRLTPLRGSDLRKTPSPRGLTGNQPIRVAGDGI